VHTNIVSAVIPVGFALDLGTGAQELWLLGALFCVALLKVTQDLVRKSRKHAADEEGPLLIFGPESAPRFGASSEPARPRPRFRDFRPPAAFEEDSETVRIDTNEDGWIQFLPGRLEVVQGRETGREYRFIRVPGQDTPEVTIGRSHGAAHLHVQIAASTVSRVHARLRFASGSWSIANLSVTNPVRINGRALSSPEEAAVLTDGDKIELGEVELRYKDGRQ
jgi:hypothetical protein